MIIVPRTVIGRDEIVSTNATDSAVYNPATSYSIGDIVHDSATDLEYESVANSNVGNTPATDDGTKWIVIGYVNSMRMFDGLISGQTERAESLTVQITPGTLVTSLVFFNTQATTITVTVDEGSTELYTEAKNTVRTDDVENIWDYFFTEPEFFSEVVFESIPGFAGTDITIELATPGGDVLVGEVIVGYARQIGQTLEGSRPTFRDFSVKDANEFGDPIIVERAFSRGAEYEVAIDPRETARIAKIITDNRARLSAFYPDRDMLNYGLTVAGFPEEFEPALAHRGRVVATIPIIGVT